MSSTSTHSFSKLRVFGILGFGITAIGFSPILVKLATDASPYLVAAGRTGIAFLLLLPFYFLRKKGEKRIISTKEHISVALAGILLGIHFIAWVSSIYYTSIASASVLVTIHPIVLILVERFFYHIRFRNTVWFGVAISFLGSVMIGYSDYDGETIHANPLLGNSLAVFAALIFAIYFLIGNRVRQKRDWLEYVFPVYGYAAATAITAYFLMEGFSVDISGMVLLICLGLALGPQIAGHGSLNYAVKYISPTVLSTLILFEPAISSTLAFFIFGEKPLPLSFAGMIVVLGGIILTWTRQASHPD